MKKQIIKALMITVIIIPIFLIIQTTEIQTATAIDRDVAEKHHTMKTNLSIKHEPLTQEKVIKITNKFMDTIVQEIDSNYKVIHFQTKEELMHEFEKIAAREVAAPFVDYYFYEEADGLYIVPTETPAWLDENNDFNMVQLSHNKVNVHQENETMFYGDYTLDIEFTHDNSWKITDLNYSYEM